MTTIDIFRNEKEIRTVSAGQSIFTEGQPGDFMYAALEGEVEIVKQGKVLETIRPGGIFGEMALIDGQPRSAAAVAKIDSKIAMVSGQRFTLLVQQAPYFALQMMQLLTDRLRRNMEA